MVLFWNLKNVLERFEPNGKNPPITLIIMQIIDFILNKFQKFKSDIKHIKPIDYLQLLISNR